MAAVGSLVFLRCRASLGDKSVAGWVVDTSEDEVVIGTSAACGEGIDHLLKASAGEVTVSFIRVPGDSVSESQPSNWKGPRAKDLPTFVSAQTAWKKVAKEDLESSDAGPATAAPRRRGKDGRLRGDLQGLGKLFAAGDDDEEEDEEDEDEEEGALPYLAPGQGRKPKAQKASKKKADDIDLHQLVREGLESGEKSSELLPMMMMAMLLEKGKKKKKDKASSSSDLLGGSSSDEEGEPDLRAKGLRAVSTLNRLHEQIKKKPEKVCRLFEREVIEELGVVPGQSWTLKDYIRKQPWGKFKGIYRCAMMDVAVYEELRSGRADVAAAQVVQNLKAKLQSVLQQGDWQSAWLLTGLPDPLSRKEFAGSKEEMAVISGYVEALANLKKKVKETQHSSQGDEEEPSGSSK